jgi:hypothetical protein
MLWRLPVHNNYRNKETDFTTHSQILSFQQYHCKYEHQSSLQNLACFGHSHWTIKN